MSGSPPLQFRDLDKVVLFGYNALTDDYEEGALNIGTANFSIDVGTDGANPPTVPGTGVRGWLRAIYERLLYGLGRTWTLSSGTDSVNVYAATPLTVATNLANATQTLTDQVGAGGVLSFVFSQQVDEIWVRSHGDVSRAELGAGTPTASKGIYCPTDEPTRIDCRATQVNVFSPATATQVSVWGFYYSAGVATPVTIYAHWASDTDTGYASNSHVGNGPQPISDNSGNLKPLTRNAGSSSYGPIYLTNQFSGKPGWKFGGQLAPFTRPQDGKTVWAGVSDWGEATFVPTPTGYVPAAAGGLLLTGKFAVPADLIAYPADQYGGPYPAGYPVYAFTIASITNGTDGIAMYAQKTTGYPNYTGPYRLYVQRIWTTGPSDELTRHTYRADYGVLPLTNAHVWEFYAGTDWTLLQDGVAVTPASAVHETYNLATGDQTSTAVAPSGWTSDMGNTSMIDANIQISSGVAQQNPTNDPPPPDMRLADVYILNVAESGAVRTARRQALGTKYGISVV